MKAKNLIWRSLLDQLCTWSSDTESKSKWRLYEVKFREGHGPVLQTLTYREVHIDLDTWKFTVVTDQGEIPFLLRLRLR